MLTIDSMPSFNISEYNLTNETLAQQISPSLWLGPYNCIFNQQFLVAQNIKLIINCGTTQDFVKILNDSSFNNNQLNLHMSHFVNIDPSEDMTVLSFDPHLNTKTLSQDEQLQLMGFISLYSRPLQSYTAQQQTFSSEPAVSLPSPVVTGPINKNLVEMNKLLTSYKSRNPKNQILLLSQDGNENASTILAISYLINNYNLNVARAFQHIKMERPYIKDLKNDEDYLQLEKYYEEYLAMRMFGGDKQTQSKRSIEVVKNANKRRRDDTTTENP